MGFPNLEGQLTAASFNSDQFPLFASLEFHCLNELLFFFLLFSCLRKGGQWLIFLPFFSLLVSGFLFRFYGMIAKQESVGYCSFPKFYFV